jgi:hypothetical protein
MKNHQPSKPTKNSKVKVAVLPSIDKTVNNFMNLVFTFLMALAVHMITGPFIRAFLQDKLHVYYYFYYGLLVFIILLAIVEITILFKITKKD